MTRHANTMNSHEVSKHKMSMITFTDIHRPRGRRTRTRVTRQQPLLCNRHGRSRARPRIHWHVVRARDDHLTHINTHTHTHTHTQTRNQVGTILCGHVRRVRAPARPRGTPRPGGTCTASRTAEPPPHSRGRAGSAATGVVRECQCAQSGREGGGEARRHTSTSVSAMCSNTS